MIARKLRTDRWELQASSFWALISAKNNLFSDPFPDRYRGRLECAKIEASLAAIRAQKEGRPEWWRIGHDSPHDLPEIEDQSLEINGPRFLGPNIG